MTKSGASSLCGKFLTVIPDPSIVESLDQG